MPHWRKKDLWRCVIGSWGHAVPETLNPLPSEIVLHKQFFSAFSTNELDVLLSSLQTKNVILSGVFLHSCVLFTAIDAYQRGYRVWIVDDATGSNQPIFAE